MIKIYVSISGGPTLTIEKYTADRGLYMSASIKQNDVQKVLSICKKLGVGTGNDKFAEEIIDPKELHCTLMYSPDKSPAIELVKNALCDKISAKIVSLKYWSGHNEKIYVVAELEGTKLHDIHNSLIEIGAEATFSPYVPHITLYKAEKLEPKMLRALHEINIGLVNNPVSIEMFCNPPSNIVKD